MASTVGIAILGCGFMGKAHSNAFRQVRRFFPGKLQPRMRVICGTQEAKAKEAADRLGWEESDTDWRRVVERKDIDIVDICTPNHLHAEQIAAAAAGKHIICEKPLATSLAEARAAADAVDRARVKHMLMFNYRRVPAVAYARRMIESGRLGRIHHYRGVYLQDNLVDPLRPLSWRTQKQFAGSGALGDIGSHAVDLALWLNGEIESVTGMLTTFIKQRPSEGGSGEVTVDDDANWPVSVTEAPECSRRRGSAPGGATRTPSTFTAATEVCDSIWNASTSWNGMTALRRPSNADSEPYPSWSAITLMLRRGGL